MDINIPEENREERRDLKDNTYEIISLVAYLIGVPKRIFEKEAEPPKLDIYQQLEQQKNARIIRHLCAVRTAIERNYRHINRKMQLEYKSLYSLPEYVPLDSIAQLSEDGVNFIKKSSSQPRHHIIEINRIISARINNCKNLFPIWLNWDYIRELFLMPEGLTEEGTKAAAQIYYDNLDQYPYHMYINWTPNNDGNILYNDKKFVTLLYKRHGDQFTKTSKVSDAGSRIKGGIYDFIADGEKIVVVVDCENSDPYKLCSVLKNLDYEFTRKISNIILFDDVHTAPAWGILERFTKIPVEHMTIERVNEGKSLVDIRLTARACQEHYQKQVDSFIIVSSDSDYWGLITSLPAARFLVMAEREKCGSSMKAALTESGIFSCYIDDFYSGNTEDIRMSALFREVYRYLDHSFHLNIYEMMDSVLRTTRIRMTNSEKQQFLDKYVRPMRILIGTDGEASIELKR